MHGRKHFLAIEDGFRESAASWKAVLLSLKDRGLGAAKLAVGDGARLLGGAGGGVSDDPRAALLGAQDDERPRQAAEAPAQRREAGVARDLADEDKYPKAVECLVKDRAELLAFYDFPAVHSQHLRTTNPIESTFATIRLRTKKTRNCVSAKSGLSLVHQLAMSAQKRWRRLRGFRQLADVLAGLKFIDGVDERISREAA